MFDNTMTMRDQVTAICKAAHFHLRNIGSIRKCITYEACEKLIHAFVTSRIDFCNATLYGLPDGQHKRLQRMLHIAARILTLTPSSNNIELVLIDLNWLPVPQRIDYKILLLTFKALHGLAPQYLSELIKLETNSSSMTTRNTNTNRLDPPKTRTKTFGDRAFASAAPALWNSLPQKVRFIDKIEQFKNEIKTHLFKSAYK